MGIEIEINSLEEMCDLMCYNKLPKRRSRMTDLIKREDAYAEIEDWLKLMRYYHSDEDESNYTMPIEELRARIERIEPVEQDRPIGHWIRDTFTRTCPFCDTMLCETDDTGDFIPDEYCPKCGAKME